MIHISVQNASDFNTLVNRLEAEGIPNIISAHQDSVFPALDTTQNFGEIRVHSEDKAKITRLLEELPFDVRLLEVAEEETTDTPQKSPNYLAIVLGIALALCLLAYIRDHRILARSSADKNYWYEWSTSGDALEVRSKSSGIVHSRYFDENFDLNYEKAETYIYPDVLNTVSLDEDEDGFFDKTIFYTADGQYVGSSGDTTGQKFLDYMEIIIETGDTLHFEDQNENGIWEWRRDY